MIAVIIPAHDEEAHLAACLQSVFVAARSKHLVGKAVHVIVVLDACTDASWSIAAEHGADVIEVQARNVGKARAAGAERALALGAEWLAFTDADTEVSPQWLSAQLALSADVVCGTISVRDWGLYGDRMERHFRATYTDEDGHRHIHGANLGVSATAYTLAGGFRPLNTGEDVALVKDLGSTGARVVWSAAPRVWTSARTVFRAPDGFGATLARVHGDHVLEAAGSA